MMEWRITPCTAHHDNQAGAPFSVYAKIFRAESKDTRITNRLEEEQEEDAHDTTITGEL